MNDSAEGVVDDPARRLGRIRESASGWHRVQLAVLGFVGLCGVLARTTESNAPRSMQIVAWPLYRAQARAGAADADGPDDLTGATRSLRMDLVATFAAVVLLALAASAGW